MEQKWILSCESTADLPYDCLQRRNIPVLFYSYMIDGREYPDDMQRDPQALPRFYQQLRQGAVPTTSQLNQQQYEDFLEPLLRQGDVLHIAFGSGMSGSVANAQRAAEALRLRFPQRRLFVVDSLCSSGGYGLLVEQADAQRQDGADLLQTLDWVLRYRTRVHHQFYSTDLQYYRRSGRISGAMAKLAAVLDLCAILRLDAAGRIVAYAKVRGARRALQTTLDEMSAHAIDGEAYTGDCVIVHSDCPQQAECARQELRRRFPHIGAVRVYEIGTIIASHCGPGTVAVFFFGDERL